MTKETTSVQGSSGVQKITQDVLIPHLVSVLKRRGGQADKREVEEEIYKICKNIFVQPYYQQSVSYGIPRWQHHIAWAKERAKKRGLIKSPDEAGRGVWALTDKGMEQLK